MKVCDITNFYSPRSGGVKTYLTQKRRFVSRQNGELSHLLIVPGEFDQRDTKEKCEILYIAGPQVAWEPNYRYIKNLTRIQEAIVSERPDIIEIGSPYLIPWAVRRVAKYLNIPLVGFFHSNFPETYVRRRTVQFGPVISSFMEALAWKYARLVYGWCDAVIATSDFSVQELKRAGINHTIKIPFGVDTDIYNPAKRDGNLKREFGISDNSIVLLYVGRLTDEKDLKSLVNAFEILEQKQPGRYALVVVGSGPSVDLINEKSKHLKNLYYAGYRNATDDLPQIYASSDIFVTPSPNETFGLSPLEALASGLPVVAVHGGAVGEIILPEGSEVASPNSPESLADAIQRMAGRLNPDLREKIRQHSVKEYSWDKTFTDLFNFYSKLLANRSK